MSNPLLDMEHDVRRLPRLFEALRALAEKGAAEPGGLEMEECEALEEVASLGRTIALRSVTAWEEAHEQRRKETHDV
jgi:hypothetical protein